jgi:hypothetical protein
MHRPKYSRTIAIAVALVAGAAGAVSSVSAVHALAGSTTTTGLVVSVAYAENVGDTGAVPIWFPTPWCTLVSATSTACSGGANPSNVTMIGQHDPNGSAPGQECAPSSKNPALTPPYCWDEGAVRLDNPTSNPITVSGIAVNVHCSTSSGKLYYGGTISPTGFNCLSGQTRKLWGAAGCSGCFFPLTIQPAKSVILTGNPPPPAHQDTFVDFDSSDTPHMNTGSCPPSTTPPTVTIASNSQGGATVTDMLTDSAHVLDTGWWINGTFGGVDSGWCPKHQNESVAWEQIGWSPRSTSPGDSSGTPRGLANTLNLSPATQTLLVIQPATVTATLTGGDGVGLANAPVNFMVTGGPNSGQSNGSTPVYTDSNGQASWTYNDNAGPTNNGADTVVATAGFIGPFSSNSACVAWGTGSCGSPPPNDFSISASPSTVTVAPGSNGTTTISTAITSGASQNVVLSASGLPSGAGASFSPPSVTSGGSSTMTITTMASTPTGTSTVSVTGTGTSATHSTPVTLVVQTSPPNDFSISASPSTVTVAAGTSGSTSINTATTSGSSQSVSMSASGFPTGAGASFSPTSVTSGSSSTMTITTSPSTPTGTTTLTVTGTGTSATHSTSVTLIVQPSPPPGCPALWTCADIGSPTPAGSESVSSGAWTINAGGSDIFSTADHFRYDYQSPGGTSNMIEAQITGQSNSNAWAKAGVMMRLDNTPGSPQFSVLITPGNGVFVEYRSIAGGTTTRAGTVAGQLPPKYIWVVRSGTTFTGWYSTTNNLGTATKLFSQTIAAMSGTVLEGLAAASHNSSALCTVTMDTVTVS